MTDRIWCRWFRVLWWLDDHLHDLGLTCVPLCLLVGRMEPRYYGGGRRV